jgi:hypothetical protein
MGSTPNTLRYATVGYSGGGEAQVQFDTDGLRYVVYSRMVRTGFGSDALHFPKDYLGVAIYRGHKLVADRRCSDAPIAGGKDHWIDEAVVARVLPLTKEVVAVDR